MRNFKRLIAIMLCVSMVIGSTFTAFAVDDLGTIDNQEKQEEVLESSESIAFDVEEETEVEEESVEASEENVEEEDESDASPETEADEETTLMVEEPEEDKVEEEVCEETVEESIEESLEETTEEVIEETVDETLEETTEVLDKVLEEKLFAAGEGTVRVLNPGWNNMKGNPYWSSPLTDIDIIEFRESNEEFTHDDMYYTWEDKGIKYYVYEIWESEDHSYTSSGFGVVIQIAEGEKLQAAVDSTSLFAGIDSLKTIKNLEMLDTSKTRTFNYMFDGCNEIEELDLSTFDTSKAVSMDGMFNDCSSLTKLDISSFNTSRVWTMKNMFKNARSLETIDVSNFDTSNVIKMEYMFATGEKTYDEDFEYQETPSKFTTIIFGDNFKTDKVNSMRGMFYGAAVKSLDLTHFDTSSVTSMCEMFDNCAFLEEIDLSSFDTSNVTDFCAMFADCYRLKSLDLSHFDTSNAVKYRYMFANCYGLEEINVSNFQGKKVEDLCNMFSMDGEATTFVYDSTGYYPIGKTQMDSNLRVIDISGIELDVNGVFAYDMFKGARNLTTIYASPKFVNKGRLINYDLFRDCDSLVGGNGTAFDGEHIWADYAVVDTDETPGYFTDINDKKYTVKFKNTMTNTVTESSVKNGNTVIEVEAEDVSGYEFKYWYIEGGNQEAFDFDTPITEAIVLCSKYDIANYTITYELNGGNFVEGFTAKDSITMFEEYTLPSPEQLEKEEANFLGWYDNKDYNGDAITSIKDVDSNITLYVKWEDFCIITMRPGPTSMDENYIHYGGASYDVKIKVGEKYTVPVNKAKVFLYYEYNDSCKYLGGQPKTGVPLNEVIYYEAYDEKGWYLGKFYGGEEIVINSKKIIFKSMWWIYGGSKISYDEIIEKYGEPDKDCAIARQKYNERKAASAAKPSNKSSGKSSGGNNGGGGGGGGSGLTLNATNPLAAETPLENPELTQMNQLGAAAPKEAPNAVKTQAEAKTASSTSYTVSKNSANWTQNADGTWSMSINNGVGQVAASNGFYSLSDVNAATGEATKAVYYFDEKGQMATGWVKDATGNMYFFETANTADVGKMTTGWKQINGGYYYFGSDGKMLTNGITPDGYRVGVNGSLEV